MKIMLIHNLGHGEHQNTPKQKPTLIETNKTQINWELIERKTRCQTRNRKGKSGLSTGENRWKPPKKCLMEASVCEGERV